MAGQKQEQELGGLLLRTGGEARWGEARRAEWLAANARAIEASNEYVDKNGLPLARLRRF